MRKLIIDIPDFTYNEIMKNKDTSNTAIYEAVRNADEIVSKASTNDDSVIKWKRLNKSLIYNIQVLIDKVVALKKDNLGKDCPYQRCDQHITCERCRVNYLNNYRIELERQYINNAIDEI